MAITQAVYMIASNFFACHKKTSKLKSAHCNIKNFTLLYSEKVKDIGSCKIQNHSFVNTYVILYGRITPVF